MGVVSLFLAGALAATAVAMGWPVGRRLLLAPIVFVGFVGLLQARDHTCVALAATGQCDLGGGLRQVEDAAERRALRRRAAAVLLKALAGTAVVTASVVALP